MEFNLTVVIHVALILVAVRRRSEVVRYGEADATDKPSIEGDVIRGFFKKLSGLMSSFCFCGDNENFFFVFTLAIFFDVYS